MTSRLFKILAILAVTALVTGCKLAIMVNEGGSVQHSGGECAQGSVCTIPIRDANFSRSFTAVAKPGYEFVKWQKAAGFLCGDSTSPTCTFTMPTDANAAAAIIATFTTGYVMPVFKDVGFDFDGDGIRNEVDEDDDNDGLLDVDDACPLNTNPNCVLESVIVNGREWAQPDLFTGVSWREINAVCPGGVCTGAVGGSYSYTNEYNEVVKTDWTYNMTGWTWASQSEVAELMGYYQGPGVGACDRFLNDGWRPMLTGGSALWHVTAFYSAPTTNAEQNRYSFISNVNVSFPCEIQFVDDSIGGMWNPMFNGGHIGAWFYRTQ